MSARVLLLGMALALAGCVQIRHVERVIPSGPPPERIEGTFNRAATEYNLLATARAKFGEAKVREALAAEAYLLAKAYPGMLPPPPPDAGPNWRYPDPPMAMLVRRGGAWLVATPDGWRAPRAESLATIQATLEDRLFWLEPEYAGPNCTDSGATLLMLKVPRRAEIVRRATCGATGRGERLAFAAVNA
jgi:hypothetical protein